MRSFAGVSSLYANQTFPLRAKHITSKFLVYRLVYVILWPLEEKEVCNDLRSLNPIFHQALLMMSLVAYAVPLATAVSAVEQLWDRSDPLAT